MTAPIETAETEHDGPPKLPPDLQVGAVDQPPTTVPPERTAVVSSDEHQPGDIHVDPIVETTPGALAEIREKFPDIASSITKESTLDQLMQQLVEKDWKDDERTRTYVQSALDQWKTEQKPPELLPNVYNANIPNSPVENTPGRLPWETNQDIAKTTTEQPITPPTLSEEDIAKRAREIYADPAENTGSDVGNWYKAQFNLYQEQHRMELSEEDIRTRAYEIFEDKGEEGKAGRATGNEKGDWYRASLELWREKAAEKKDALTAEDDHVATVNPDDHVDDDQHLDDPDQHPADDDKHLDDDEHAAADEHLVARADEVISASSEQEDAPPALVEIKERFPDIAESITADTTLDQLMEQLVQKGWDDDEKTRNYVQPVLDQWKTEHSSAATTPTQEPQPVVAAEPTGDPDPGIATAPAPQTKTTAVQPNLPAPGATPVATTEAAAPPPPVKEQRQGRLRRFFSVFGKKSKN